MKGKTDKAHRAKAWRKVSFVDSNMMVVVKLQESELEFEATNLHELCIKYGAYEYADKVSVLWNARASCAFDCDKLKLCTLEQDIYVFNRDRDDYDDEEGEDEEDVTESIDGSDNQSKASESSSNKRVRVNDADDIIANANTHYAALAPPFICDVHRDQTEKLLEVLRKRLGDDI